jgi:hypothetical protein
MAAPAKKFSGVKAAEHFAETLDGVGFDLGDRDYRTYRRRQSIRAI